MAKNLTLEGNIITAIKEHLTSTNLLAPTAEVTLLAEALTQVVFEQLQEGGVDLAAWTRIDVSEKRALAQGAA
jgi:hypothetical protein